MWKLEARDDRVSRV
uniref:Uncharacterized protein n=1 Tax=Arundo donax TaxID=35708 RepID=A0A0A9C0K2_ARUDO